MNISKHYSIIQLKGRIEVRDRRDRKEGRKEGRRNILIKLN
jgi:hypothetical protein